MRTACGATAPDRSARRCGVHIGIILLGITSIVYGETPAARQTLFENQFDDREQWNRDPKSGTLTCADGIGSFRDTRQGQELKDVSPPTWTIRANGVAPAGSYLEVRIKAATDVKYWVDLVNATNQSIATIPLGAGNGDWQVRRVAFEGQFGSKGDDLFVRVKKSTDEDGANDTVQIDYIGIYHGDAMQNQSDAQSRRDPHENLALGRHECFVLSSSFENVAEHYTDNLIDGNAKTIWRSWPAAPMPQWVELRWEYPVQLNRVCLRPAPTGWPQRFSLQRDDARQWVTIQTIDAPPVWPTDGIDAPFETITTDRLRVVFDGADGDAVALAEIEAYGPPQPLIFRLRPYWRAHYIWYPEPDHAVKTEPRFFRKTFDVTDVATVSGAFLQMRSNDNYIVWINGREVARGSIVIQPIDVKHALRSGSNCIAVRADVRKDPSWPLMTMLAELTINDASGTRTIGSDATWRAGTRADEGWDQAEFDDSGWPTAFICRTPPDQPWGRIPYFDRSARQRAAVRNIKVDPPVATPGQRVQIEIQLEPTEALKQDFLFLLTAGEREINSDRSNYVVAKAVATADSPPSNWRPGEPARVRAVLALPSYAPDGRTPLRIEALGLSSQASLELTGADEIGFIEVRRAATASAPPEDASASIGHTGGVCSIQIAGQRYSPLMWALQTPSLDRFGSYSATGIHLYHLQIYPYRIEPNADYAATHFAFIDQHIRHLLRIDPAARVLVEMDLRDTRRWADAHPDDRLTTAQGVKTSACFASRAYADAVSGFVRQLVRFINAQPYANHVIGYIPEIAEPESALGGAEQNQFQADRAKLNIGDHNPQAIDKFRRFLREKYDNSEAALRAAWKDPAVTFDIAQPRLEDLVRPGVHDGSVFRDPTEGRMPFDYFEFLSTLVPDFVLENVARVVKQETDGKAMVGFYYGYTVETMRSTNNPGALLQGNHFKFDRIIDSPDIDFFISPLQYDHRMAGDRMFPFQPYASLRLHRKLYVAEEDIRTHVAGLTSYGRQRSEQESIAVLQNHLGTALIGGSGAWMADWSSGSGHSRTAVPFFTAPPLLATIEKMKAIHDDALDVPRTSDTQVAVFVSDKTQYYHDVAHASVLYRSLITDMLYDQMPYIGAPFDIYMMEDVEQPFVRDQYRLYIFLNAFFMDANQRAAVDALKRDGKTLLFFYAPGYVSNERGLQTSDVRAVSGFEVDASFEKQKLECFTTDLRHPILEGIARNTRFAAEGYDYAPQSARLHPTAISPRFTVADKRASVLARYADGGAALAALEHAEGWKSIYAAVPFLDAAALRNIARWAGVHLYVDDRIVVEACQEFLLLHNGHERDRSAQVRLRRRADVVDLLHDRPVAADADRFTAPLPRCSTALYRLK